MPKVAMTILALGGMKEEFETHLIDFLTVAMTILALGGMKARIVQTIQTVLRLVAMTILA